MIITRTPFRISLFGGGTDFPAYFGRSGKFGQVLSTAIDKYCWISARRLPPFFEHRHRVVYTKVETVRQIAEIQHPAVREALLRSSIDEGLEIHHDGDLPARSGIGSSSSFVVGLIHALHALRGQQVTARQLASEAIDLERGALSEAGGWQDQIAAAHGGFNRVRFVGDTYEVDPVLIGANARDALQESLQLFWTGLPRSSAKVTSSWAPAEHEAALDWNVRSVDLAWTALAGGRILDLGQLLHEAWSRKRELSTAVSTPEVDDAYSAALDAGALGGKLLGAGGGGFLLLITPLKIRWNVTRRLSKFLPVPFKFERAGSKVVVYEP